MEMQFDFERMEELLRSFFKITNIRYSLMDRDNRIVCASSELSLFCRRMNADAEGSQLCAQCDAAAIQKAAGVKEGHIVYTCHAGLTEAVIPVRQHGQILAYIFFGQMANQGDPEEQWRITREKIGWMSNPDEMREAFLSLKRTDKNIVEGCAKILEACSAYIWMEGMIRSSTMTDEQLLISFIDSHYAEQLTLDSAAKALSMSKTKLCGVASRQGSTVMKMVNDRRMEEAKRLFRNRSDRISEIAYLVGVKDYNYFTKLFKAYTGETPRAYQKRYQKRKP